MEPIKIDITILKPIQLVWDLMNDPKHIVKWNYSEEKWHCTKAENDFRPGGRLSTRIESKDGSYGYNFVGIYDEIVPLEKIRYHMEDGRTVEIFFTPVDAETTKVTQIFDAQTRDSREMQRDSWYRILNNFHKYVENFRQ